MFLETFNMYSTHDQDSSDCEAEETRQFYKKDADLEISIGDKIYVTSGELQKVYGKVVSLEDGGNMINFKPSNIQGFDDTVCIERPLAVKYFEQGDQVRVVEGKYMYETGIVMLVDDNNVTMPTVKMDSNDLEAAISTAFLKLRDKNEKDELKMKKIQKMNGVSEKEVHYKVGEVVIYNQNRVHGYLIEVTTDRVRLVNDKGQIENLRVLDIEKKLIQDKTLCVRDS